MQNSNLTGKRHITRWIIKNRISNFTYIDVNALGCKLGQQLLFTA